MTGETHKPDERVTNREDEQEPQELERFELEQVVGGEKARPGVGPATSTSPNLLQ